MIEAYKKFWKGYVDFEGRSTRSDYWFGIFGKYVNSYCFLLCCWQSLEALQVLQNQAFLLLFHSSSIYLFCLWCCCHLTCLAVTVRRLRDAGYNWPYILLHLFHL